MDAQYIYLSTAQSNYLNNIQSYNISNSATCDDVIILKIICIDPNKYIPIILSSLEKSYECKDNYIHAPSDIIIKCIVNIVLSKEPHILKAMNKGHASRVKIGGHLTEKLFAQLIGGEVIGGKCKSDVRLNDITFSIKGNCKRIQFALYSANSKFWNNDILSLRASRECLLIFPETYEIYKDNENKVKEELAKKINSLYEILLDINNLKELLLHIIFNNNEVKYLVMRDEDRFLIYEANEVINILSLLRICKSARRKSISSDGLKVLLKANIKGKESNLIEMEIRNSSTQHYAEFLYVCNSNKLFDTLNNNIRTIREIKKNIYLVGEAITLENYISTEI